MPKFKVRLTREASESLDLIIDADDDIEAGEKALEAAGRYGENLDNWELDEGNDHEVYLPDECDGIEEIPDEDVASVTWNTESFAVKSEFLRLHNYAKAWATHAWTWLPASVQDAFASSITDRK